jgi:hypothetical protein
MNEFAGPVYVIIVEGRGVKYYNVERGPEV